MKPLIIGGKGNLGTQLAAVIPEPVIWDKEEVDITKPEKLKQKLNSVSGIVDVVINCAAYNDVDGAEDNEELAYKLNAEAPKNLAIFTSQLNLPLVHYSTGYVFRGSKDSYLETNKPDPISVYGKSKAAGEEGVIKNTDKFYIIRTNLLFGPKGVSADAKPSVVDVMLDLGRKTNKLKGVVDEAASFTYTPDLAHATFDLLGKDYPYGIYHLVNKGYGSWYDLAEQIFKILGYEILDKESDRPLGGKYIELIPVKGAEFKRAAKRPDRSVLQNNKGPKLRSWQEALEDYLNSINADQKD